MARTRVRRPRAAALLSAGAIALLAGPASRAFARDAGPSEPAVVRYVVRPGDTLWGIAERRAPADADPRPLIDRIVAINDLGAGPIVPGRTIVVPADPSTG